MQKKFYLSQSDKKIGGVCGGLADYFDVDPFMVRLIFFIAIICGTIGFWIYIFMWLMAPKRA